MNTFDITTTSRVLPWEDSSNTRDMGGYRLGDGKHLRWRALVRSETLCHLTAKGQQSLVDYGIRTVIDLRFQYELDHEPNPFAARKPSTSEKVDYFHISLDRDQDMVWVEGMNPAESMSRMYCQILESNRNHVTKVLTTIAHARPGGVVFHCFVGKDRTGLIAALILGLLGASADIIAADYEMSEPLLARRVEKILAKPNLPRDQIGLYRAQFSAYPESMMRTLAYLDEKYGGISGYLLTTDVQQEVIDRLRERLVENLDH